MKINTAQIPAATTSELMRDLRAALRESLGTPEGRQRLNDYKEQKRKEQL